jgi:hypothetical protein
MPEQVSKLKNEAGNAFTGRMEAMFNDMRVSIDTNESFREYSENSHDAEAGAQARKDGGVELVAHVLTTGCWPSVSAKQEVRVQHVLPQLESRAARKKGAFFTGEDSAQVHVPPAQVVCVRLPLLDI